MKKIKVLYVVSTLERSGPTDQLYNTVYNIKEKTECRILTLSQEKRNSAIQDFVTNGIIVDCLDLRRSNTFIKGLYKIKTYINKYQPDVIHTSGIRADVIVGNSVYRRMQCVTIHNKASEDYPSLYGNILGRIMAYIQIRTFTKVKAPICCAKELKRYYESKTKKKFYVIQNGIHINKFIPREYKESIIRRREVLGLNKDAYIFISYGALITRKDPICILEAFLQANLENTQLVMIGKGELWKRCYSYSNKNIKVIPYVEDIRDYIEVADTFVTASHSEGFPSAVLEAGCEGLGIICSDIPQHREIFEKYEDIYEDYFPVGDVKKLTEKMKTIRRRERVNNNMEKYFRKTYTDKRMAEEYLTIYEHIREKDI